MRPPIQILDTPPKEPYVCSAVPLAVDVSLDSARRSTLEVYGIDFLSLPIEVDVIDAKGKPRTVTPWLSIIGDHQMVLDLTSAGAALAKDDRRIAFSWDRRVRSVIPVLSPESESQTCKTDHVLVQPAVASFTPPHTQGNQDYDLEGPCIEFWLTLRPDALKRRLEAKVEMKAYQCKDDFAKPQDTEAWGYDIFELFRVENTTDVIVSHDLAPRQEHRYIDNDRQDDIYFFPGTSPVEKLVYVGDMDGIDAGTRTKVDVYFRELRIEVLKCRTD